MMRTRPAIQGHTDPVGNAVRRHGAGLPVDEVVRASWNRCINTYSLDPQETRRPTMVERADLQARRERLGVVLAIARIEMEGLGKLMEHSEYSIMLTDRDGVILSYVGDPGFSAIARRCGFREGVMWSEREMGTNGMGTCLMTQRSVVIHRTDHFLAQNTQLTCSAAPIFDMRGQLLAALDISGASSNTQTHTLALVDMAAQNVENRTFLGACKEFHLLRFHRCAEFVSTPGEGVVAFDDQGIIKGANRGALKLLGLRDHESLCGQRVDRVLDTSLGALMQLSGRQGFRPEALSATLGARRWFATVHAPAELARRASVPASATAAAAATTTAPETRGSLDCLHSADAAMMHNVDILRRVVDRDISVLLLGETGTGKGYCARAIHNASRRADKPFVAVNCAAIPENLIESELFGHKPGAFTGATREGSMGRILQANGGTLFLDEIGDMPLPLQARLLNVIEDREVMPLGGNKVVSVDVRILSATQRDPVDLIAKGLFREDLYYRLNGITVRMPPLRQRTDRADLIRKLLQSETGAGPAVDIEPALLERLVRHSWPGNVRQVRNVVRTMLALRASDRLTLADFSDDWLSGGSAAPSPGSEMRHAEVDADGESVLSGAERDALRRTLEGCRWNVSAAAARLHISRRTMYRKMHRHGLVRHGFNGAPGSRELV
ncbi:MAG TPA: sigma-54-dependent Fis family transcriptional regulator [Steroidobacteraceae bacterium]|jgi:transcriptional regulator of acetoin/glycerol metabolism|nr:sigma-54-dependent Fis family transcriptional regulator [Steroidobacteraceae bacterium]